MTFLTGEFLKAVVLAIVGSSAVVSFVQFMIQRHDNKKGRNASIDKRLEKFDRQLERCERDNCRTQMLLLMSDYPDDERELLRLAEHYFKPQSAGGLEGDWYMTGMFNRYLIAKNIGVPEWFDPSK